MKNRLNLIASLLLFAMALTSITHWMLLPQFPLWVSGALGWTALVLLMLSSALDVFRLFFVLSAVGILCIALAISRGAELSISTLLTQNNGIIVMLYCVGFLRMVARRATESDPLPVGRMAFVKTLLGVHLLGAIINASMLVLTADRLKAHGALGKHGMIAVVRGFATAAFWSPFFAAMAVALTYAPGAQLGPVMLTGLALSVVALGLTVAEQGGRGLRKLTTFRGYPTHLPDLAIPFFLAAAVLVLHNLFEQLPVLMLVSTMSLLVAMLTLVWTKTSQASELLSGHIKTGAPRMVREFTLFMGAAVLTVGLQALSGTYEQLLPFDHIGGQELSLLLLAALIASTAGVHPVVSISIIGPTVMPLNPDTNMLAILFLAIWGIGVVINPFSGVNTILRGQFDGEIMDLIRWNVRYVVIMWLVFTALFYLY